MLLGAASALAVDARTSRAKRQAAARRHWHKTHPLQAATASWFGGESTACGAYVSMGVAHKSLPCGTKIRLCTSRCITVPVMDRGPYIPGRTWDLGEAAKDELGCDGVCTVHWRLAWPGHRR